MRVNMNKTKVMISGERQMVRQKAARCHGPLQMEKGDKGSTLIRMGVSG